MIYNLNKNIAVSEAGFIFNPVSGESFSVNPVGIEIVNFLKEGRSLAEIREMIAKEYEIDADAAERDLLEFISLLNHYRLAESNAR